MGIIILIAYFFSYEHRHHIGSSVLKLCLRELFEIECMQTDPNWSNFLYDVDNKRLMLIDFGSTRFYQKKFIQNYRQVRPVLRLYLLLYTKIIHTIFCR